MSESELCMSQTYDSLAPFPSCERCLVLLAHPDDAESWCAGTLARLIDTGAQVTYVVCTSGEKGTAQPEANPEKIARLREEEQREACRRLGVAEVIFLGYPDGGLEDTSEFRGELVRQIRRVRPDLCLTFDPVYPRPLYTAHRDHRVLGRVALDALYPYARDPQHYPEQLREEGLQPHITPEVWLFASSQPDYLVDISTTFERKVAARLAHASQTANTGALEEAFRQRAEEVGRPAGLALAEAFKRVFL
jgi:LmbE family N-acetylglucosaminyl deacetylase